MADNKVNLAFSVKCNNVQRTDLTKEQILLTENDIPIQDFTVQCADTTIRCCVSVAFVIDRSGSMGVGNPSGIEGVRAGVKAFIDRMDGACDEASLITFNSQVQVDVFMTNDRDLLKASADGMVAMGGSAVWDAGVAGINEVVGNGTQSCRAIIFLTDSDDLGSTHTAPEMQTLAQGKNVRVFPIALGSYLDTTALQAIANVSRGRFFKTSNPGELVSIFEQISSLVSRSFNDCSVRFSPMCPDGSRKQIRLTVLPISGCGDTTSQTIEYTSTRDTSLFTTVQFDLGQVTKFENEVVRVPLTIRTPLSWLPQSIWKVKFDPSRLRFVGIDTGSLLSGVPITVKQSSNQIEIQTTNPKALQNAGDLLYLKFSFVEPLLDEATPLQFAEASISSACHYISKENGFVRYVSPYRLTSPTGRETFCAGSTQTIAWATVISSDVDIDLSYDGGVTFSQSIAKNYSGSAFLWNIPDTIPEGSACKLRIRESNGNRYGISIANFSLFHKPAVSSQPMNVRACANGNTSFSVRTVAGLSPQYVQWQVSTDSGKTFQDISGGTEADFFLNGIQTSQQQHRYRAAITNGCGTAYSDAATLVVDARAPQFLTQPQPIDACVGDSVRFAVTATDASKYQWFQNTVPIAGETATQLILRNVSKQQAGEITVHIENACGAISSQSARLRIFTVPLIDAQPVDNVAKPDDSISFRVSASGKDLTYQWMKDGVPIPGETKDMLSILRVDKSHEGNYSVRISSPCGVVSSNAARLIVILTSIEESSTLPNDASITEILPNPTSEAAMIRYFLAREGEAMLVVHSLLGTEITKVKFDTRNTGAQTFILDTKDYKTGVYFVKLLFGKTVSTKKLIIAR